MSGKFIIQNQTSYLLSETMKIILQFSAWL